MDYEKIQEEVIEKLKRVDSLSQLESLKSEYLGRKGKIRSLKKVDTDKRRELGKILNLLKDDIEKAFEKKRNELLDRVEHFDITEPGKPWLGVGSLHPIYIVANRIGV